MADSLLHQGATVMCMHTGQAQPTVTSQRVKVSNQPIVTQSSTYSIAGCTLPTQAGGPCATAQWVSAATKVRANGVLVLMKGGQDTLYANSGTAYYFRSEIWGSVDFIYGDQMALVASVLKGDNAVKDVIAYINTLR